MQKTQAGHSQGKRGAGIYIETANPLVRRDHLSTSGHSAEGAGHRVRASLEVPWGTSQCLSHNGGAQRVLALLSHPAIGK